MEKVNGRILTVTMNPAIDIQYRVEDFQLDRVFRSEPPQKTPGGKGLNVSRVIEQMGKPVTATGVLGGNSGRWIKNQLSLTGIHERFTSIGRETRECIAIIGKDSQTEILGRGPVVSEDEVDEFLKGFEGLVKEHSIICISGSLPEGVEDTFYRDLISMANGYNCKVILDSSGQPLQNALAERPFLIKPNREEMEAVIGRKINGLEEVIKAGRYLREMGAQNVLISLGGEGGVFIGKETLLLKIPEIQVKNPVGSGDASVAGFAYALSEGMGLEEILAFSMACGLSNTMNEGTGQVVAEDVFRLKNNIGIKRV